MSAVQRKKFTQRNVFYLRASPYVVLQTILYLDYRHVEWMNLNPSILTQVLSILRTRIMPKLRKESDSSGKLSAMSKKERVDVYSDRDFQVAYFFRRMDDRHSVLLKEKSLVFPSDPTLAEVKLEEDGERLHAPIPRASATPAPAANVSVSTQGESSAQPVRIKDSPEPALPPSPNAHLLSTLSPATDEQEQNALFRGGSATEDALSMPPPASTSTSTRRTRNSSQPAAADAPSRSSKRVRIQDDADDVKPDPSAIEIDDIAPESEPEPASQPPAEEQPYDENAAIVITEEDEEKLKPKLHVKYAGFRIFGKLLVLVVEPSKRTLAAHPELFGDKKTTEVRQLSVAPRSMTPGVANNRSGSVQARFTSLEPGTRSSRDASVGRGTTPLFRGATPAEGESGGKPGPLFRGSVTPALRQDSAIPSEAGGSFEGDGEAGTDDDGPTIGELEGIELATQMLAREEQRMGGNDIEEGD